MGTADLAREGDQREDWMGRTGSPIYKGKLRDYDLPFVRSFQLFCPIKISIFSPITTALTGLPFAVAPALPRLLRLPSASFVLRATLPRHPPYGGIDRAQPPVILPPSRPSLILLYSHRFLLIVLLSASCQPQGSFLSRSLIFLSPTLSV